MVANLSDTEFNFPIQWRHFNAATNPFFYEVETGNAALTTSWRKHKAVLITISWRVQRDQETVPPRLLCRGLEAIVQSCCWNGNVADVYLFIC